MTNSLTPADAQQWYLQDTRTYVGNDMLFWAKDGGGYTTDVSKAHVFTKVEAYRQHEIRDTDRPWPKWYIDGKTRPAVDFQYVNHKQALWEKPAASLRSAQAPQPIPQGFVLVPVEPTTEMLEPFARQWCYERGFNADEPMPPHGDYPRWYNACDGFAEMYRAMLAASPEAPKPEVPSYPTTRSGEARTTDALPARVLAMCKARGWSLHWTHRGAYLHLESSELIEALRGKRGDPLCEAADVLLVLMSITESNGIAWSDVLAQCVRTVDKLETKPRYPGEEFSSDSASVQLGSDPTPAEGKTGMAPTLEDLAIAIRELPCTPPENPASLSDFGHAYSVGFSDGCACSAAVVESWAGNGATERTGQDEKGGFKYVGKVDFHISAEFDLVIGTKLYVRAAGVEGSKND